MLGSALSLARLARQNLPWTPLQLSPIFWGGALRPQLPARLFQDASASTSADTGGQAIGHLIPLMGGPKLTQSTANMRPILVRWPKGGRQNLRSASASAPTVQSAVTATPLSDTPGGFTLTGLATASGIRANWVLTDNLASQWVTASFEVRAPTGLEGEQITFSLTRRSGTASSATINGALTHDWQILQGSILLNADNLTGVELRLNHSEGRSPAVQLRNIQIEQNATATPFQWVNSAADITQAGQSEVWHLYNNGNKSMPAILPSGSYGVAWTDQLGTTSSTTIMSDGLTPSELLLGERQSDMVICLGSLSSEQLTAISTYWATCFAG